MASLKLGCVLLCFCVLCSCTERADSEIRGAHPVFLRYADEQSQQYPSTAAGHEFARICHERSHGAILVRVYDDRRLGLEAELVEQIRFGGIDLARVHVRNLEELSPVAARMSEFGAFASASDIEAQMKGPQGKALVEELLAEKIVLLSWFDGGPEYRLESRKRPLGLETGAKVAVQASRSLMDWIAAGGDTPVPMGLSEFRHAYTTRLADVFIMPLLAADAEQLLDILRPVPTEASRSLELLVASRVTYQKMLPGDREILLRVAEEVRSYQEELRSAAESRLLISMGFMQ